MRLNKEWNQGQLTCTKIAKIVMERSNWQTFHEKEALADAILVCAAEGVPVTIAFNTPLGYTEHTFLPAKLLNSAVIEVLGEAREYKVRPPGMPNEKEVE